MTAEDLVLQVMELSAKIAAAKKVADELAEAEQAARRAWEKADSALGDLQRERRHVMTRLDVVLAGGEDPGPRSPLRHQPQAAEVAA